MPHWVNAADALQLGELSTWSLEAAHDRLTLSPGFAALLGLPDDAAPRTLSALLLHVPVEERARVEVELLDGEHERVESIVPVSTRDGRSRTLLLRGRRNRDGDLLGVALDVTRAGEHERDRSDRSARACRLLFENMRDGFAATDERGFIVTTNAAFRALVGYDADELSRMRYQDLTPSRWHAAEAEVIGRQVGTKGYSDVYEKEYVRKDGSIVPVELRVLLLREEGEHVGKIWGIVRDVSARHEAQAALRASQELLLEAERLAALGSWEYDPDALGNRWSPEMYVLHGLDPARPLHNPWGEFEVTAMHPDDVVPTSVAWKAALEAGRLEPIHYRARRADGGWRVVRTEGRTVARAAGKPALRGFAQDVTERVEAKAVIARQLAEKEVLLRELHHRVKNNLQVVSSLIALQARRAGSSEVAAMFAETSGRVAAMALVHEKLQGAGDQAHVDLAGYAGELAAGILASLGADRERIAVAVEGGGVRLELERAVTAGLVLHELVTNAVKHAFPAGRRGRIIVRVGSVAGSNEVVVADDGIGEVVPRPEPVGALGWRLLPRLAAQLGGTLERVEGPGTGHRLRFPGAGPGGGA